MDSLAMILLTIPIFYPMVMGLDFFGMSVPDKSVWFGILALMVVEIGLVHPPVGMNLFIIQKLARTCPTSRPPRASCPSWPRTSSASASWYSFRPSRSGWCTRWADPP